MSPLYKFAQLESTNDEAANPKYKHGDIICAEAQSKGRGQRGNKWDSEDGANLTFSLVLEPEFLKANQQFYLLEAVALSLVDMLGRYDIQAKVKWTNDIYVGDDKLAGILIDNDIYGENLGRSVVGIGLNINQATFASWVPNPTSMSLLLGHKLDKQEVLDAFYLSFISRFQMLIDGTFSSLSTDYHQALYLLGEAHTYKLPNGTSFEGTILGVSPNGELSVEDNTGKVRKFLFKEIIF